jgi:hypothetical protein
MRSEKETEREGLLREWFGKLTTGLRELTRNGIINQGWTRINTDSEREDLIAAKERMEHKDRNFYRSERREQRSRATDCMDYTEEKNNREIRATHQMEFLPQMESDVKTRIPRQAREGQRENENVKSGMEPQIARITQMEKPNMTKEFNHG